MLFKLTRHGICTQLLECHYRNRRNRRNRRNWRNRCVNIRSTDGQNDSRYSGNKHAISYGIKCPRIEY